MCHHSALCLLPVVVVEEAEVLSERWFQSRVTLLNVERVRVVGDVEQLRDAGLRRVGPVVDAQVADLAEAVAEVEGRGDVEDIACGVDADALVVLDIVRLLWLCHHTGVELPFGTYHAQHELHDMRVVLIFRVAAQVRVEIIGIGVGEAIEIVVP